MDQGRVIQILLIEADSSRWPQAEAFFQHQLGLVGASSKLHPRRKLPERAAGFDLISIDGLGAVNTLLEHADLLEDLRRTAIVNLHADPPGPSYGHLRRLLQREGEGQRADGLWVFPISWMAPWFQESLDFPELNLSSKPQGAGEGTSTSHPMDHAHTVSMPPTTDFLLEKEA